MRRLLYDFAEIKEIV